MMMKRVDGELMSIKKETLKLEDKIANFFIRKEIGQLYTKLVEKSIRYLGQTTRFYLADLTIDIETIIDLTKGSEDYGIVKAFLEKKNNNFEQLCNEWENKGSRPTDAVYLSQRALTDAILAIRAALKIKDDNYTRSHMDNVTYYAEAIARMYGLDEEEISIVKTEAYFHDIGKIIIPDYILTKPGKLNKDETKKMTLHAKYGADMLRTLIGGDYEEVIFGVENHHKKYSEIKNAETCKALYCAIVTLADAFDAMTTDRPYRKNMGYDYAISELKKHSGTQFNPELVELVLESDVLNPKNFAAYRSAIIH